jgi:hypothetical protein
VSDVLLGDLGAKLATGMLGGAPGH